MESGWLLIHAQYVNRISKGKILGLELFLWFLYCSVHGHAFFGFVHAGAQVLALFLYGSGVHMILLEFVKHLHSLVCVFLGVCKNLAGLLVGLPENTLLALIQLLLLGLQLLL